MKPYAFVLLILFTPFLSQAGEILLQSGEKQNTIVELYTSEGCNSCPPAEQLLNSYKQRTDVWQSIIPMAFHVDYWDYLGWKDKFAQTAFGIRQREYAKLQRRSTVYTPAFYVNGENWRPGFIYKGLSRLSEQKVGNLKIRIHQQKIHAVFTPIKPGKDPLKLNIALLGMGLKTQINAGENEGRLSMHEFVVLDHQQYTSHNSRWDVVWSKKLNNKAPQYAIAAWVSKQKDPTPIQATGSYLTKGFIP